MLFRSDLPSLFQCELFGWLTAIETKLVLVPQVEQCLGGTIQLGLHSLNHHLASRKLGWRTATERLTGNTPDISMFRFHFWEEIEYFNPITKQPEHGWLPGRFLGIAWDVGDHLTYFIETDKPKGRNVILARSTIRPRQPNSSLDSGERTEHTYNDSEESLSK